MNNNGPETGLSDVAQTGLGANLVALLIFILSVNTPLVADEINTEQIEKNHKLQNIRTQIRDVETSIETAKNNVEQLFQQLQDNEIEAAAVSASIQHLQRGISEKNAELQDLDQRKTVQETRLAEQRQYLSQQIRAAYKTGGNNYLKLLLNQQNPEHVGRVLAYYNYDVRARSKRITDINTALTEISLLEQQIQSETQVLTQLQHDQEKKLEEFQAYRSSREEITSTLHTYIDEQGAQLQILQSNEKELANLVNELKDKELAIQIFEDTPPFNSLQGRLDWPIRGKIASRFGSLRKGGQLKWQGVTIAAKTGVEVKAITTGKVVFADWFRNLGLLMILDHGDGFMSLYGHNERLLKKPGDWVLAGDSIARVGDTGGQQKSGLYFEIRQNGNPINPDLWCKN